MAKKKKEKKGCVSSAKTVTTINVRTFLLSDKLHKTKQKWGVGWGLNIWETDLIPAHFDLKETVNVTYCTSEHCVLLWSDNIAQSLIQTERAKSNFHWYKQKEQNQIFFATHVSARPNQGYNCKSIRLTSTRHTQETFANVSLSTFSSIRKHKTRKSNCEILTKDYTSHTVGNTIFAGIL